MKIAGSVLVCALATLIISCNTEVQRLAQQNDSLRHELQNAQHIIENFQQAGASITKIKAFEAVPFEKSHPAIAAKDLENNIQTVAEHLSAISDTVRLLDKQLHRARYENSAYVMMVDALKGELQIRVDEVTELEESISEVERVNRKMMIDNDRATMELLATIDEKQILLSGLQNRLTRLQIDFQNSEAEAVYARARAVEESARKTRFAPLKRKEAFNEALELYKKARSLGKVEADHDIVLLQRTHTARAAVKPANTAL